MKVCSKCQAKNDDASRFCKQCGIQFSTPTLQQKREKVLGGQRKTTWRLIAMILSVFILGGIAYWVIEAKTSPNPTVGTPLVPGGIDYTGQTIRMTDITAKVGKGKIAIPLNAVKDNKIVRFEYDGKGVQVPLLSYMTLAGRVVTAISMCEPCRSTRFHIQDKALVCNACYTEWNLETLKGIKGGCMNYPPEVIPNTVENGQILIDEKLIVNWKPRA